MGITGWSDYTEYGTPSTPRPWRVAGVVGYGWLGGKQRSTTDATAGLTLMGARLYNPSCGSFTSTDPVAGGNENTYNYPTDPINHHDLDGRVSKWWSKVHRAHIAAVCAVSVGSGCPRVKHISEHLAKLFPSGTAYGNFQRHFVWLVLLSKHFGVSSAGDLSAAHEWGMIKHGNKQERADSRRDRKNNAAILNWIRQNGWIYKFNLRRLAHEAGYLWGTGMGERKPA